MGLLDMVLLPITGPWHGFVAVLKAIQEELEAQTMDESRIQGELMQLEVRHSSAQISDEEYESQQAEIMEHLDDIRARKEELLEAQANAERSMQ